jgi:hypothetical protein
VSAPNNAEDFKMVTKGLSFQGEHGRMQPSASALSTLAQPLTQSQIDAASRFWSGGWESKEFLQLKQAFPGRHDAIRVKAIVLNTLYGILCDYPAGEAGHHFALMLVGEFHSFRTHRFRATSDLPFQPSSCIRNLQGIRSRQGDEI